jgi:organic radical activating enzyme
MIAEIADTARSNGRVSLLGRLRPTQMRKSFDTSVGFLKWMYHGVKRREGWFVDNLTFRKAANMAVTVGQFAVKSEQMHTMPVAVKIDISPMCNLSCTVCVHADPNGNAALEKQDFDPKHRMSVEQFRTIIDQIRGRTAAVSLYYIGDPLVHPNLDEMCGIAYDAGLNVHISTNFSFALTDARIRRMVTSGLTHLSVCVDGLSQEKYQMTRVGGRIDRVLDNLKRICKVRDEMHRTFPKVEVQYIKFQHNVDELEKARQLVLSYGVDQVTDFWGALNNYTDGDPDVVAVLAPNKNDKLPQCFWPHSSRSSFCFLSAENFSKDSAALSRSLSCV